MASEFIYRLQPLLEQKEEIKKDAERDLGSKREKELESQQVETLPALQQTVKDLVEKRQQMRANCSASRPTASR